MFKLYPKDKSLGFSLKKAHKLTNVEYKKRFPGEKLQLTSIRCKEYWIDKGYTKEEAIQKIHDIQSKSGKAAIGKVTSIWSKKYWIDKGYTKEEAIQKIHDIQSKNSAKSSKFKGHNQTIQSKRKISISLSNHIKIVGKGKWHAHFSKATKVCVSKLEIKVYNELNSYYSNTSNILESNKRLMFDNKVYVPDIIYNGNIIIEIFGDYWHANLIKYTENQIITFPGNNVKLVKDIWNKDKIRIDIFKQHGFKCIVVWENEIMKNLNITIKNIIKFIDEITEANS